jgi:hypothetical protein
LLALAPYGGALRKLLVFAAPTRTNRRTDAVERK